MGILRKNCKEKILFDSTKWLLKKLVSNSFFISLGKSSKIKRRDYE